MSAILECKGLCKHYGRTAALADVTLSLPEGRIVGLLGPNGSGKTTLIKIAAGLLTPSAGTISIAGSPVGERTKAAVSYLPEQTYLPAWMRVCECLDYFGDFFADFDRVRAEAMLAALSVPLDARLKTLSKGTREKVQLVLVMSRRAQLYLLDEPIGGVDPATRDYILTTIVRNYDEKATILLSTHLIADVEKVLDEFLFLREGRVVRYDSTDAVREDEGKSIDELFREVFKC